MRPRSLTQSQISGILSDIQHNNILYVTLWAANVAYGSVGEVRLDRYCKIVRLVSNTNYDSSWFLRAFDDEYNLEDYFFFDNYWHAWAYVQQQKSAETA